jgi:chemotaxis signal transduction protein
VPDFDVPWVIAHLGECVMAVESTWATEMIVVPEIAAVPLAPAYVRGIGTRRGAAFTVLDLRVLLGLSTLSAENAALLALLSEREQDHRHWLAELEASITESRAFTLTTDPTLCAFGRWYASYQAPNEVLARHLRAFEEPHRAIHGVACQVEELLKKGARDEAAILVARAREDQLARLLHLFQSTAAVLHDSTRETVIIHDAGHDALGIAVDRIAAVARLDPASFQPLSVISAEAGEMIVGTARVPGSKEIVLLLDSAAMTRKTGVGFARDQEAFAPAT